MSEEEFYELLADIFLSEWRDYANCIDTDPAIWFDPDREEEAEKCCNCCAVQLECFDNAVVKGDDHGYRAFSEKARVKIKRHRGRYNKLFEYDLKRAGAIEAQVRIL